MLRSLTAVGVVLAGVLPLAALAPRPRLDNAVASWFPAHDPHLGAYRSFLADFGADEVVVVQLGGGDGPGLLRLVGEVAEVAAEAPGVERVLGPHTAFPTAFELLSDPELGGMDNLGTCGWVLSGPLNGALHLLDLGPSPRARLFLLLAPGPPRERAALEAALLPFRERARAEGRELLLAGQPLVNLELDRAAREVDRVAMPLLVGVCVLVLLAALRSPRAVLALLLPVGLGVFASEGLLGLWGGSTNLVVAIAKPLLFVLLLACGFHVAVATLDARRAGASAERAAWRAARRKAPACLLALFTTAIGFGSLALSDVGPVRTFGLCTAAGLGLGAPLLLLLLPGLLALFGGRGLPPRDSVGPLLARLVGWAESRARWVLAVALLCVLCGAGAARGLRVQPHAIDYFPADHWLRRDHERLERDGAPLVGLELVVRGARPLHTDAEALASLDRWARGIVAAEPEVHACLSLPLLYREAGYRTARQDAMPAGFLLPDVFAKRAEEFSPFVADAGRALRFSLVLDTLGPREVERLRERLEASFRAAFPADEGLELTLTGSYELLMHTQRSLLTTLRESLLTTAVLMQLVLFVALGSLRVGFAGLLPNAIPVAVLFLFMRGAGMGVDVGTSMTAAVALGIAVDDTLHFLHAWQRHGTHATATSTGRAILFTSLVIGLGFLSVTTSRFTPTRDFGLLCAAAMLAALG
ncbi:MAG: hypothetical protein D6731_15410, partial [Planctomycetota bacterium]